MLLSAGMAAEVSSNTDDFDQTFVLLFIVDAQESLRSFILC